MRKSVKYTLIGVVIVTVMISSFMYCGHTLYERTYSSQYYYEIQIDPDSSLNGVVLYVPLPVCDSVSQVGDIIKAGNAKNPENIHCSVVYTEYGAMLRILADYIDEPAVIAVLKPADTTIDTKNPLQTEMVLSPKYDLIQVACDFPHPEKWDNQLACFEYQTMLYAEFTPLGSLTVSVTLEGRNTWWILGWSGNSYRDQILATVNGESGWHRARGELVQGEGLYSWI
ncbi:MAG: hypothetical protein HXS52_06505 [Theionarchaea archaeon]|nr:hypothetical protein [Theionarchaea archaeon]MBU7037564.1 hypothetical protein [Theionarchaea archaeon]